jgi:hypothetical protein
MEAILKSEILPVEGAICIAFEFERTLDHEQIVEMARIVERAVETDRELRLLLDLRRTEKFALGAFLSPQGFLASVRSIGPVSRYAVVGAPTIVASAVEAFGTIMPLESRAFAASDIDAARRWVTD